MLAAVEGEDSAEADTSVAADSEAATLEVADLVVAISVEAEAFILVARPWEDSTAGVWAEPAIPLPQAPRTAVLSM